MSPFFQAQLEFHAVQLHQFAQELRNTEINYSHGSINDSLNGKVSLAYATGPEENIAEENSFLFIRFFFFFPAPFNSFDWFANIQGFSFTLISYEKCVCFRC